MKKRLLIVDDNIMNREMFCEILGDEYQTQQAGNGKEALEILEKYWRNIDLILLDLLMPVMDGYDFMKQWNQHPYLSDIPIIVITQLEGDDEEVRALSLGASDFLSKPYNPVIIKQRIANLIKLRDTARMMQRVGQDAVTKILNKEAFYQKANDIIHSALAEKYDIICSDIENFKLVNDLFGIKRGDEILRHFASIWERNVKGKGICGRIGADTFAALIPAGKVYQEKDFLAITDRLNDYPINIHLHVRYGIFPVTDSTVPINLMCDRALLIAKSIKGKYGKCFSYYDESFRKKLLNGQFITDNMEKAVHENQFQVYLQPKFHLLSEKVAGAEALVRWMHPERGLISPNDFISLFEANGFITTMDQYVWEVVCQTIRRFKDKGWQELPISVNVSRIDIYSIDLVEVMMKLLQKYELEPKDLHLEITETAYTENPQQIIEVVARLKELGFIIEMDDFGTGYSSLNMLSELPVDTLKLDMRFIQSEFKRNRGQNIISFVINLAKWMKLAVIVEGVETKEQVDYLKTIDCHYVQGFYFAKPMPIDSFESLIGKKITQSRRRNHEE